MKLPSSPLPPAPLVSGMPKIAADPTPSRPVLRWSMVFAAAGAAGAGLGQLLAPWLASLPGGQGYAGAALGGLVGAAMAIALPLLARAMAGAGQPANPASAPAVAAPGPQRLAREDRKSTRLNSSHG